MAAESRRQILIRRTGLGTFRAHNPRGGTIDVGGQGDNFTAVELLLVAMASCSGADVDHITSKRSEPTSFQVEASGEKIRDQDGNRLIDLEVRFLVEFPEGPQGDAARSVLGQAITQSHDRLCTVSRTIEIGTMIRSVAQI